MYDVIIVGMGISGITAAIYAKRSNMKVLLLDKAMPGGLLNSIEEIGNYPGLPNISGPDFAQALLAQIQDLKIEYKLDEVVEFVLNEDVKKVVTKKETYESKYVILALGRKPKYLGLDNEKDYLGRGLSTCAVCDAFAYKNAPIAVVGTGNSALQESLYLSKVVSKIYLLNRRDGFRGEDFLVEKVKNDPKIEIKYNVNVKKINESEDGKISSVTLDNNETLEVKGVFIYVGYRPDTDLLKEYPILDEEGYIDVNDAFESQVSGVFAIGDVIRKEVYQLVTAASDGAIVINGINKRK
ncbi:MAG: FAD-dependent oxidoreductase [Bacilli bacterium]|nr:FAD-dependent oxidoreductase [Bacilli bacterium]